MEVCLASDVGQWCHTVRQDFCAGVLPAHVQDLHADSGRGVRQVAYRYVDDLATVWCEWAEMELRHKQFRRALDIMRRATAAPELLTRRQARQLRAFVPVSERSA